MANKVLPTTAAYTTAIPFDQPITYLGEHTVTAPITFTPVTTGAEVSFGAILRLVADGTNDPDFSAFSETGGSGYDNTAGVVNQVIFFFDGVDYCFAVNQPGTVSGGGATPLSTPGSFALTVISSTAIDAAWSDVANESSYELQLSTTSDFSAGVTTVPKAAGSTSHSFTGLTASTHYYARLKAVGDGVTYSDSPYATDDDTTSSGGSIDATAQLVIDAINLTGAGPLSGPDEIFVNDIVVGMRDVAGTWTLRDAVFIPVWGDADANAINWKDPSGGVLAWQPTPTHGATGVLGVGIMPVNLSTLAHVSQDSINISYYLQSAPVPAALESYAGVQDASNTAGLYYYAGPGGNVGGGMNNGEASVTALSPAAGYEAVDRPNSGQFMIVRNGVVAYTKVVASTGVPAGRKLRFGAMETSGGGQAYPSTAIWSAGLVGGSLTSTQQADEYTVIQDAFTDKGINV